MQSNMGSICNEGACTVNYETKSNIVDIWFSGTYEEALQQAREQQKPVMLDLFASWCIPCKQLQEIFVSPRVKELLTNLICISMDAEEGEGALIASKYNIKTYPTVIFISPSGKEIDRFEGNTGEEVLIEMLIAAIKGIKFTEHMIVKLLNDPDDIQLLFDTAIALRDEDPCKSKILLQRIIYLDPDNIDEINDQVEWVIISLSDDDTLKSKLTEFLNKYKSSRFRLDAYSRLADIYTEEHSYEKAVEIYRDAIADLPEAARLYVEYSEFLWVHGFALPEAVRLAEMAVELAPEYPDTIYRYHAEIRQKT